MSIQFIFTNINHEIHNFNKMVFSDGLFFMKAQKCNSFQIKFFLGRPKNVISFGLFHSFLVENFLQIAHKSFHMFFFFLQISRQKQLVRTSKVRFRYHFFQSYIFFISIPRVTLDQSGLFQRRIIPTYVCNSTGLRTLTPFTPRRLLTIL